MHFELTLSLSMAGPVVGQNLTEHLKRVCQEKEQVIIILLLLRRHGCMQVGKGVTYPLESYITTTITPRILLLIYTSVKSNGINTRILAYALYYLLIYCSMYKDVYSWDALYV